MLKYLVHSQPKTLHTFDDFYRNTSKPIKTRSATTDSTSSNSISSSPGSPSSPSSHLYTFYNIFSDFKCHPTSDALPEEDETEREIDDDPSKPESLPSTPLFYLEEDPHPVQQQPQSHSSPHHWPSLFHRFRHPSQLIKQSSISESQMFTTKQRKSDLIDGSTSKHRFLKRAATLENTGRALEKKCSHDDFPELSLPVPNPVRKHRSFVSVLHHIHQSSLSSTSSGSSHSNSTGTLPTDSHQHPESIPRPRLIKQKAMQSPQEFPSSPVSKSPSTPILPKLASLFHRHPHLSEQYKHRVGNLKARLHHRRTSPPSINPPTKFQCQVSNALIDQIKQDDEQQPEIEYLYCQRSCKPVVMKRVHTWHNTFDLRPIDQCLEY